MKLPNQSPPVGKTRHHNAKELANGIQQLSYSDDRYCEEGCYDGPSEYRSECLDRCRANSRRY